MKGVIGLYQYVQDWSSGGEGTVSVKLKLFFCMLLIVSLSLSLKSSGGEVNVS